MRFDYDAGDWQLLARILEENSLRLSRTRSGVSDTSTSPAKHPLLLAGEALRRQSAENEKRVQQYLFRTRRDPAPRDQREVLALLWTLANLANEGLLSASQKFRSWPSLRKPPAPVSERVRPEELPAALERFAGELHSRWAELSDDPVPLASWAEWELNGGSLHPFYDGCGRISRSFGALLLLRGSYLLPLYEDHDSYFVHGHQGPAAFAAYVGQRIEVCARWLEAGAAAISLR